MKKTNLLVLFVGALVFLMAACEETDLRAVSGIEYPEIASSSSSSRDDIVESSSSAAESSSSAEESSSSAEGNVESSSSVIEIASSSSTPRGDYGRELVSIAYHEKLHPAKGFVVMPISAHYCINSIKKICTDHGYLIYYQ